MNENKIERQQHQNPFFVPYNTPHNTVPFDKITTKDYEEAFMEGIKREDEEIDAIIAVPPQVRIAPKYMWFPSTIFLCGLWKKRLCRIRG